MKASPPLKPSSFSALRIGVLLACPLGGALQAGAQPAPAPRSAPAGAPGNLAPVRFLVVAAQESVLSASAPGRFAKVPVSLGDTVRAGQVLAAYECDEIQARGIAAHDCRRGDHLGVEQRAGTQQPQEIAAVPVRVVHHGCNAATSI